MRALFLSFLFAAIGTGNMFYKSFALEVQSHRGKLSKSDPENKISQFDKAVNGGVNSIELDLQLTADNEVVLFHDDKISGNKIAQLTLAELLSLDPSIDTLKGLVEWYKKVGPSNLILDLELKNPGLSEERGGKLLSIVLKAFVKPLIHDNIRVRSFDPQIIESLVRSNLNVTSVLLTGKRRDWIKAAQKINPKMIAPYYKDVTEEKMKSAKKLGLKVFPWTVNSKKDFERLKDFGVFGITTDNAAEFKDCADTL